MELEAIIPLHSEFVPAGFQLYLLDLKLALELEEVEPGLTLAFIVLTRRDGLLLALPELALASEILEEGNQLGSQALVGPSTRLEVAGAALDEEAITGLPSQIEGRTLTVLVVDFTNDVLAFLKVVESQEELDLVAKALAWASADEDRDVRVQFYSAEDVPETPNGPTAKRAARRRGPGGGMPGESTARAAPKKKPTVTQLAENLETLTASLPGITQKLQALAQRTEMIERERGMGAPSRPSALRAPLGPSATAGFAKASSPAELLKTMPPPRGSSNQTSAHHVSFSQQEVAEIDAELTGQTSDLACAMMEQSKAITALVSQIAANSSDPIQELGSVSSSLSSKGSQGRARLQAELAAHRGTFFTSVLQSMSRRMFPAQSAEVEMSSLRERGVTATQYLERHGGYGRTRDVGMIIWQIAMVMNYMQEENHQAAKDALSLLFVCLEQTALDGGNMQVGLLLSLQEDPTISMLHQNPLICGCLGEDLLVSNWQLVELERFAASSDTFISDFYAGSSEVRPSREAQIGKIQEEHRFVSGEPFNAIKPYSSFNVERLKLSGEGKWPLADFLEDILWLPFLEPKILRHNYEPDWEGPDSSKESKDENEKLCRLWDVKGLLSLFPSLPEDRLCCRVFNAHKNALVDRQIGDRRWVNGAELHPTGPSAYLPSGPAITMIHCERSMKLVGSASDRRDFYHQAAVSRERAFSNVLPFEFLADHWRGSSAFKEMLEVHQRPFSREKDGDRYGMQPRKILVEDEVKTVVSGFKSLFQGDHLGVEFALSSHATLLKGFGLMSPEVAILRHTPFPAGPVWHGLVIDDFFCISREKVGLRNDLSQSVKDLETAEKAYARHGVVGSDDKTVRGAENFKVIGAEVLSDARSDRKTFIGNLIAFRCLAILWFSYRYGELGLLEQPRLSKMAWLSIWRFLLKIGLTEAHLDSCAFGSPHRKPFRLLGHGLDVEGLNVRCGGGHRHLRIEGKYAKASAIYHPNLAKFLAKKIAAGLRKGKQFEESTKPQLESVVLNDLLQREGWKVESDWDWKRPARINILESRSYVGLMRHLVIEGGDRRFTALLDSRVAKGAHAKGRSSAKALQPSLQRSCAYAIAGNLHPSLGFSPTRLNTADAPTRLKPLPTPATYSILDFVSPHHLVSLHSHQFSRGVAGWRYGLSFLQHASVLVRAAGLTAR
eukprot:s568_g6.t1